MVNMQQQMGKNNKIKPDGKSFQVNVELKVKVFMGINSDVSLWDFSSYHEPYILKKIIISFQIFRSKVIQRD